MAKGNIKITSGNWLKVWKKVKWQSYLVSYVKINFIWLKNLNVKTLMLGKIDGRRRRGR